MAAWEMSQMETRLISAGESEGGASVLGELAMASKRMAWPMPKVTECLEGGLGTVARPLTRQLYCQTQDLRHLAPPPARVVEKEPRRCGCLCATAVIWVSIVVCVVCFLGGMWAESAYLHRFKRRRHWRPDELRVGCPGDSYRLSVSRVRQWEGRKGMVALSAATSGDCESQCGSDRYCVRAFFNPASRDCWMWEESVCSVPEIPSRDNTADIFARDCVDENCTLVEKICSDCAGGTPLSALSHLKFCLRIADFNDVCDDICA